MLFGLGTFIAYIYFVANFDTLTLGEAKNFIIFVPILFILALIELFCEIKYGIKKSFQLTGKATRWSYRRIKYKILKNKLAKNKQLSERQTKWLKKYIKENNKNDC